MAVVKELNHTVWESWVSSRPPIIQEMCRKWPPDRLYQMDTMHRCTIYSYSEDGMVTVRITGQYNLIPFDRQVFGIDPASLHECDLPRDEVLGAMDGSTGSFLPTGFSKS